MTNLHIGFARLMYHFHCESLLFFKKNTNKHLFEFYPTSSLLSHLESFFAVCSFMNVNKMPLSKLVFSIEVFALFYLVPQKLWRQAVRVLDPLQARRKQEKEREKEREREREREAKRKTIREVER